MKVSKNIIIAVGFLLLIVALATCVIFASMPEDVRENTQRLSKTSAQFATTSEQIDHLRIWNGKYSWGFSEAEIIRAEELVPTMPVSEYSIYVLVPYTGLVNSELIDSPGVRANGSISFVEGTVLELSKVISDEYESKIEQSSITSINDTEYRTGHPYQPTEQVLTWERIEIDRVDIDQAMNEASADERGHEYAHAATFAFIAHNEPWIRENYWLPKDHESYDGSPAYCLAAYGFSVRDSGYGQVNDKNSVSIAIYPTVSWATKDGLPAHSGNRAEPSVDPETRILRVNGGINQCTAITLLEVIPVPR